MYNIRLLKALADETRLSIISVLQKKELSVSEIVSLVNKSQPNVSISLKKLDDSGLIEHKKEGQKVIYSIKDKEKLKKLLDLVKNEV